MGPRRPRPPAQRNRPEKRRVVFRDATGRPVPGARVTVRERKEPQIGPFQRRVRGPAGDTVLTSDEAGGVSLTQREGYTYELVIEAENHATKVVTPGASFASFFELVSPARISGVVTSQSGQPVVGARVSSHQNGKVETSLTSESGAYTLLTPGPGAAWLTVTHDDHLPEVAYVTGLIAGNSRELNIFMRPGLLLSGTVKPKRAGPPPAGASVKVIDVLQQTVNSTVITGYDGSFSTYAVERGREYVVVVEAAGHAPMAHSVTIPQSGSWDPLLLEIESGQQRVGRVIDVLAAPVRSAHVLVSCTMEGHELFQTQLLTDSEGEFFLPPVDSRSQVLIHVVAEGFATGFRSFGAEDLTAINESLTVPLVGEATLHGIAVNEATGVPIPQVAIRVRPVDDEGAVISDNQVITMTNDLGEYELTGLPPGRIEVVTIRAGYDSLRALFTLQPGEHLQKELRLVSLNPDGH